MAVEQVGGLVHALERLQLPATEGQNLQGDATMGRGQGGRGGGRGGRRGSPQGRPSPVAEPQDSWSDLAGFEFYVKVFRD